MNKPTPQTFTLVLTPLPGWSIPAVARVKRALKYLLRWHGLRCISVVESPSPAATTPNAGNDSPEFKPENAHVG